MQMLVTGRTGFVGQHLAQALLGGGIVALPFEPLAGGAEQVS
jgi:nucleoside-diphosphate-sugar epimerase